MHVLHAHPGRACTDARSFTPVVNAFAEGGDVAGARGMMRRMRDEGVPPNIVTYNTLIKAIARSGAPDAGAQAEAVLDEMAQAPASNPTRTASTPP